MDPSVLAFTLVVLAALVFGVATAPLGLVLGLGPGPTAVGVFLGSAAFVFISVPMVTDRVPDRLARQIRRGVVHGPRVALWWRRPAGDRATGNRAAALVTRCSSVLDRLGYRGIAVLAPVAGRWLVPAAGIVVDAPRPSLYRWAALGCATWAVLGTVGTDLLMQLVRQP
jgi:hypothetical protein